MQGKASSITTENSVVSLAWTAVTCSVSLMYLGHLHLCTLNCLGQKCFSDCLTVTAKCVTTWRLEDSPPLFIISNPPHIKHMAVIGSVRPRTGGKLTEQEGG